MSVESVKANFCPHYNLVYKLYNSLVYICIVKEDDRIESLFAITKEGVINKNKRCDIIIDHVLECARKKDMEYTRESNNYKEQLEQAEQEYSKVRNEVKSLRKRYKDSLKNSFSEAVSLITASPYYLNQKPKDWLINQAITHTSITPEEVVFMSKGEIIHKIKNAIKLP